MSIASLLSTGIKIVGALTGVSDVVRSLPTPPAATGMGFVQPQLPTVMPGAGFSSGGGFPSTTSRAMTLTAAGVPRGYHYAKDGSGKVVRNRRMNPCNPHALRRAARRIKSFRKLAHKVEMSLPKHTVHSRAKR